MTPKRPILRYHGGKWRLAPWIISQFNQHRIYVEPFAGAASVLLQKPRTYSEVYNDLDGQIVNLFRVLRNPANARELLRVVKLTPYSREEFEESYIIADDPIEQARKTLFRSMAGFSSVGATGKWKTGFRGNVTRTGTTPAHDWRSFPAAIEQVIERLRGVVIENDDARSVISRYDGPDTLFYVDPPYPFDTRFERWAGEAYAHEMSDDDHRSLADCLKLCRGQVVISGYACRLYDDELFSTWYRVERKAHSDGAKDRIEVLWMNRPGNALPLFSHLDNDNFFSDLFGLSVDDLDTTEVLP